MGYEGNTCSITCNTGYELTGSDTRTCQSDGSWNGSDTACRRGNDSRNCLSHQFLKFALAIPGYKIH